MSLASKYPLAIRLYNRIRRNKPINYQKLLKAAERKEKLSDFGDEYMIQHLKFLCDCINKEAKLHPFGNFITEQRLIGILRNRLRAVEWFKRHPEINDIVVKPPIIITGLQRTGTTFMHRLLGTIPENRALISWEALNPAPLFTANDEKKRIGQARTSQKALKYISPVFFTIHPVEYNSPEEDVLLNDMTLLSAVPEATMHVPSFSKWAAEQDHSLAYDWLYKLLQLLQFQNKHKGQTWVLKTPQHLEYMDVIVKRFPKATIIHTHRDPKQCIPSFCSMVYHSRRIFSQEVSPTEVAEHWVNKNVYMLQQMRAAQEQNPHLKIIDIQYQDFVKAPLETIKSIYQNMNKPWSADAETAIKKALTVNKKDKYGKHHYRQADFGLTDEIIDQKFEFYTQNYLSHEQK